MIKLSNSMYIYYITATNMPNGFQKMTVTIVVNYMVTRVIFCHVVRTHFYWPSRKIKEQSSKAKHYIIISTLMQPHI